ncbi:hypothetical protein HW532_07230 [Kaustia mangrovi]|uniref:Tyrosine specific protein phosphatases domain-containing protein n=1 Tax=Kaustia mangrovi TaxID=2593653 RepID=A0A7S8C395_9HYPH|nr:hypothetical protein [Kaustia mangrovi]QPC42517.1 hypothetical protein HW532_07230 [Kaustia mangrovi]
MFGEHSPGPSRRMGAPAAMQDVRSELERYRVSLAPPMQGRLESSGLINYRGDKVARVRCGDGHVNCYVKPRHRSAGRDVYEVMERKGGGMTPLSLPLLVERRAGRTDWEVVPGRPDAPPKWEIPERWKSKTEGDNFINWKTVNDSPADALAVIKGVNAKSAYDREPAKFKMVSDPNDPGNPGKRISVWTYSGNRVELSDGTETPAHQVTFFDKDLGIAGPRLTFLGKTAAQRPADSAVDRTMRLISEQDVVLFAELRRDDEIADTGTVWPAPGETVSSQAGSIRAGGEGTAGQHRYRDFTFTPHDDPGKARPLRVLYIPVEDGQALSANELEDIVPTIDAQLSQMRQDRPDGRLYMSCAHGHGRTGTVYQAMAGRLAHDQGRLNDYTLQSVYTDVVYQGLRERGHKFIEEAEQRRAVYDYMVRLVDADRARADPEAGPA